MVLRSATSYALSPAYYCSSVFWTTLGYSSSSSSATAHDRLLTALSSSSRRTIIAAPTLGRKEEVGEGIMREEGVVEKDDKLERWEVERVERALREAMREDDDEVENVDFPVQQQEGVEPLAVEEEGDTSSTPRPSSAPLSSPSSPTLSFSTPVTPTRRPRPSSPPPATPLSAIHRLSRRSTLCLSTLYRLSTHPDLLSLPLTEEETIAALDSAATAAEEAAMEEPGEKEREMVERVLGGEVQRVREEVERVVEEVLEAEGDEREEGEAVQEEEKEAAEEKVEPATAMEGRRAVVTSEASWAEVTSLDEQKKEPLAVEEQEVKTWFSSPAGQAFASIPIITEGVDTAAFLRAVESMVDMAELLAPTAASLCAADVRADIARVHSRLTSHPSTSHTLESLIRSECKEAAAAAAAKGRGRKRPAAHMPATESAVWLVRLLKFVSTAFRFNLDSLEKEELSVSFTRAWEDDFSRHVNWLVRPLFKVILRACPSRSLVYSRLAQGTPVEQLEGEMRVWVEGVERVVERVEGFLKSEKVRA